jgi:translation initiation factor 2B subunit (eIF-2B alpha/beta/delta family)
VDARLRHELAAIARDRQSGAAELALRAVKALEAWLRRHPKPAEKELLGVARALLLAQPSMAPLLRLANEAALAADKSSPSELRGALQAFRRTLVTAPRRIAAQFCAKIARLQPSVVATYSYSSTVLRTLLAAKSSLQMVWCSEGRPGWEGRRAARKLASAGLKVILTSDAALLEAGTAADLLVVGADAVQQHGFRNKIGTAVLVEGMAAARKSAWVLADSTKFWPEDAFDSKTTLLQPKNGPPEEICSQPSEGLLAWNPYFAPCRYLPNVRILCERGWMNARQVEAAVGKLRLSPRLYELAR